MQKRYSCNQRFFVLSPVQVKVAQAQMDQVTGLKIKSVMVTVLFSVFLFLQHNFFCFTNNFLLITNNSWAGFLCDVNFLKVQQFSLILPYYT